MKKYLSCFLILLAAASLLVMCILAAYEKTQIANWPLVTIPQFFACFAIMSFVVGTAFWAFQWKILIFLNSRDIAENGKVVPRKFNLITCYIQVLSSVLACVSILTGDIALCILLFAIAGVLWWFYWDTSRTFIDYKEDHFTYTHGNTTVSYCARDVRDVHMLPTKIFGCMRLEILLVSGKTIHLQQIDHAGVNAFYTWLMLQRSGK